MVMQRPRHHLRVLVARVNELEDQGHLDPGQATAARRIVSRMKRALSGTRGQRPNQARKCLHEAVVDLVELLMRMNERGKQK